MAVLVIGAWGMFDRLVYGHLPMVYGSYVPWGCGWLLTSSLWV